MAPKIKAKDIGVAIIGLGYWGPNLVRNFYKTQGTDVAGVCDLSKERLQIIKKDYPSIKLLTSNYGEILNSKGIAAVAIATPVRTHFSLAKQALEAGKHVLIEKPLTETSQEAEELIKLADKKKLTLMVDHTFVYTPAVRKIKELIDSGELGKIHYIDSTRVNLGLFQSDVNVIWDLAPHDFSIINFLIGSRPTSLSAFGIKHPDDDKESVAYLMIKYPESIVAHVNVSWFSPVKMRTMLIGGSNKMIVYDHIHPSEPVKVYDYGVKIDSKRGDPFNPVYRSGDIQIPKVESTEGLAEVCKEFVKSIQEKKKPKTGGREGLEVVRLLEGSEEALKKGREVKLR